MNGQSDVPLAISVDRRDTDATVMVAGEVDPVTAPQVRKALRALLACGVTDVTVDFSEVEFICSAGLNVLIELVDETRSVTVRNPNEAIRRVMSITAVDTILAIAPPGRNGR